MPYNLPNDIPRVLDQAIKILGDGLDPEHRRGATVVLDPLLEELRNYDFPRDILREMQAARGAIGTGLRPEEGLAALRQIRRAHWP